MAIFNLGNRKVNQTGTGQQLPDNRLPAVGTKPDDGRNYFSRPMSGMQGQGQDEERYIQDVNTQIEVQAEEFTQKFPAFNMDEELKNPTFRYYIWAMKLNVEEAYMLTHKDEIWEQLQASETPKSRPRILENGTGRVYPAATRPNIAEMSDEELDAIAARAAKGERITFD